MEQRQDGLLGRWECRDGRVEQTVAPAARRPLVGENAVVRKTVRRLGLGKRRPAAATVEVVERGMVGHAGDPHGEPGVAAEAGEPAPDADERLLAHVLALGRVGDEPADDVRDKPLVALDERTERPACVGGVGRKRPADKLLVVGGHAGGTGAAARRLHRHPASPHARPHVQPLQTGPGLFGTPHSPPTPVAGELVPITLFLVTAAVVIVGILSRARNRRLLIERGLMDERYSAVLAAEARLRTHSALRWGLVLGGFSLGLIIADTLGAEPFLGPPGTGEGAVLLGAALGFLAYYLVARKETFDADGPPPGARAAGVSRESVQAPPPTG